MMTSNPHPTRWQYCVVSTPPPGPVQVYVTYFRTGGMHREVYNATSYDDGVQRLWPKIIAEMGLDGWELVFVDQAGSYYFRRVLSSDDEANEDAPTSADE